MKQPEELGGVERLIGEYTTRGLSRRDFFRRAAGLGLSLGAAGALLAACGGSSDGDGEAATSTASTGAGGEETSAATTAPAEGEPVKGGQLVEGYDRDFSALDTVLTTWDDPTMVAVYEFTVARDAAGAYVPDIVDAWEISDDLLTWTFTIPSGRTFQSGAPLDAQMIADNFNLFRDPNEGQNAIFWPTVMDVTAPDATTVVVTMKAPFTAFPETLATEAAMIENLKMREELGEGYGTQGADGTGPFTLATFKPGTEVVVERWDEYPGSNLPYLQNKGPAYLDSVKWVPILDVGNRANEIETGNVNVVTSPAPQDVERLKSNSDLVVVSFPALANYFLAPNFGETQLGFDDLNVRQAISHAIDRQAIVDSIFFGQAVATYGPIAPNFKWYDPGVEQFNQFDPDKAKSLLDQAGWVEGSDGVREKGGQKLSFSNLNNGAAQPTTQAIDEAIVAMLKDVGVDMKLDIPDAADFFTKLLDPENPPESWTFEWLWSSPVDLLIYFAAFPSKEFNGDLPDINAAIAKWQEAPDDAALEAAAKELQLAWAEELPEIPILTRNSVWVHQTTVMGYQPLETMLYPFYNDVWLAA